MIIPQSPTCIYNNNAHSIYRRVQHLILIYNSNWMWLHERSIIIPKARMSWLNIIFNWNIFGWILFPFHMHVLFFQFCTNFHLFCSMLSGKPKRIYSDWHIPLNSIKTVTKIYVQFVSVQIVNWNPWLEKKIEYCTLFGFDLWMKIRLNFTYDLKCSKIKWMNFWENAPFRCDLIGNSICFKKKFF